MAICKEVEKKIKSHQYVYDSIAYALSPENSDGAEVKPSRVGKFFKNLFRDIVGF